MLIKFWGVRGSVPTPDADKMQVGGNTACIELNNGKSRLILDMGTGIRGLGKIVAKEIGKLPEKKEIFILLSHTHWDHIQGFPFFGPIFMNNANINILGPERANRKLGDLLAGQMEYDYFPVKFTHVPAKINVFELSEGHHRIFDGLQISAKRHIHPGVTFGYRIQFDNTSIVYSTDTEHYQNVIDKRVVDIAEGADILIHDAQYTDEEIGFRLGWGHSTWRQSIQVAQEAKVKKLVLFHSDPDRSDDDSFKIENEAQKIFPSACLARDSLELEL